MNAQITQLVERAKEKGHRDAIAGWDKADNVDWADLVDRAGDILGIDTATDETYDAISAQYTEAKAAIADAYWEGWRQGYQERGGGRALTDLANQLGISYDTLAKAARENRLPAWKSGGIYLSTFDSVDLAIKRGTMRLNSESRKALDEILEQRMVAKLSHLIGKTTIDEITDPDVAEWAKLRLEAKAKSERDHNLIMLGYNQAMLDYSGAMDLDAEERQRLEKVVAWQKSKLGFESK